MSRRKYFEPKESPLSWLSFNIDYSSYLGEEKRGKEVLVSLVKVDKKFRGHLGFHK